MHNKGWLSSAPSPHGCIKHLGRETKTCKRVGVTWEVTDSTHKQHTLTYYTISLEVCSDSAELKRKLKLTKEIVPPSLTSPQPPLILLQMYNS